MTSDKPVVRIYFFSSLLLLGFVACAVFQIYTGERVWLIMACQLIMTAIVLICMLPPLKMNASTMSYGSLAEKRLIDMTALKTNRRKHQIDLLLLPAHTRWELEQAADAAKVTITLVPDAPDEADCKVFSITNQT